MYTTAVSIYNRVMHNADALTLAKQLAVPSAPHPRPARPSPDLTPELSTNYAHYAAAVATADTSILSLITPALEAALSCQPAHLQPVLRRVVEFLLSGAEQFEGASMGGMSAMYWQAGSDGSGAVECDMLVQRGYGDVVRALGEGLDIRLRHVVRRIDYAGPEVRLEVEVEDAEERVLSKETFLCRHVIVTVPLGVLKRSGALSFDPPLPAAKAHAIDSFGFGLMNKIVLQFDRPWWGDDVISIGYCSQQRRAVPLDPLPAPRADAQPLSAGRAPPALVPRGGHQGQPVRPGLLLHGGCGEGGGG